jgi:hypothetical protein
MDVHEIFYEDVDCIPVNYKSINGICEDGSEHEGSIRY